MAPDCDEIGRKRGFCRKHYERLMRHGDLDADFRLTKPEACAQPSCSREVYASGYCVPHWRRVKAGKPLDTPLRVVNVRVPCVTPGCDGVALSSDAECRRCRHRRQYAENPEPFKARVTLRRTRSDLDEAEREISLGYRLAIADDPCRYCGSTEAIEVDHVFPLALGGTDHWWNLAPACRSCNRRKHAHCGTWWNLRRGTWADVGAAA